MSQSPPAAIRENVLNGESLTGLKCRKICIGEHQYEPKENVTISDKGIRIVAPSVPAKETTPVELNIQTREIAKVVYHTSKKLSFASLFVVPSCLEYIREKLGVSEMAQDNVPRLTWYTVHNSRTKIILLMENCVSNFKNMLANILKIELWRLEEISETDAVKWLKSSECHAVGSAKPSPQNNLENAKAAAPPQNNLGQIMLIYPTGNRGLQIEIVDYTCLATDQYLNDVIIDFYLNYLINTVLTPEQKTRTHIFNSYFYKRLTTFDSSRDEPDVENQGLTAAEKRHARVKKWTKNVNIFTKDFIVIPINRNSHWFLVIICYPLLNGPVIPMMEGGERPAKRRPSSASKARLPKKNKEKSVYVPGTDSERDEAESDGSDLESEEEGAFDQDTPPPMKQPCVLIFDSVANKPRRRVVATLREYLTCEYRAKGNRNSPRVFTKETLPGCSVKVPQQDNSTDCGLYLLQYVEHFFRNPIKDYLLPIQGLQNWFASIVATRKREDIAKILIELCAVFNPSVLPAIPEIEFPTIDGHLR